MHKNTHT